MAEAAKKKAAIKTKKEEKDGDNPKDNQHTNQGTDKEQHEEVAETTEAKDKPAVAKAGKRSSKAVKEAEEKAEKEARKTEKASENTEKSTKPAAKPARLRLERQGKKFRDAAKLIDKTKSYNLKDGLELAIKTSPVKFDATVELHLNLNLDPRQADQNLRGTLSLPAGTGKTLRVTVLGEPDEVAAAKKAGADEAGNEDVLTKLEKGTIDFDVLITTPQQMAKLGKYARLLGPKGLMPNPKSGTVTRDIAKAVTEAKAGRVEYRVDDNGIVHMAIGKVSFGAAKLTDNAQAVFASIKSAKPVSVKGNYVQSVYLTTSMGPSIRLQASDVL